MKKAVFGVLAILLVMGAGCSTVQPEENLNKEDEPIKLDDAVYVEDSEINLVGSWSVSGADYEEISIDDNSMFTTYMNGQMLELGAWVYEGEIFVLKGPLTEKVYNEIIVEGESVTLVGGGIREVWQLINEG